MRQPFDNMVAVNVDQPPWELPPNVWSDSRNVRLRDGATERFTGQAQVFGSALGSPLRLLPITDGTNFFWVYASTANIYATDGVSHGDITPAAITPITDNIPGWTGGAFQGFMVVSNGTDDPYTWDPALLNQCIPLVNWPADLQCQVIRPYRNYLFALRCTENGIYNPRLLRWGSSANPASLPDSWDHTDPTVDTGRVEFGQTGDQIIDLIPMRDIGVLYKENYTWSVQFRGGIDNPFQFRQIFSQVGMLSEWCAAQWEGKHIVLSTNDLVIHDLNQAESLIDKQYRRWLFNQIDGNNYRQSFVVPNYKEREIWTCIPEAGNDFANLALVWNYNDGGVYVRELGKAMPHINWGVVTGGTAGDTFATLSGTFEDQVGAFDEQQFNPALSSLLMSDNSNLLQADTGGEYDGQMISAFWERRSLPLDKDVLRYAMVKRVFPKVIGTPGETITIYIGTRNNIEDEVNFSTPRTYTIGTDAFVNFLEMGRIIDIRFEYDGTSPLRLHGFDVEWDSHGYH